MEMNEMNQESKHKCFPKLHHVCGLRPIMFETDYAVNK